jgi:hypothetical protein
VVAAPVFRPSFTSPQSLHLKVRHHTRKEALKIQVLVPVVVAGVKETNSVSAVTVPDTTSPEFARPLWVSIIDSFRTCTTRILLYLDPITRRAHPASFILSYTRTRRVVEGITENADKLDPQPSRQAQPHDIACGALL